MADAQLVPLTSHSPTPDTISQVERMAAYGIAESAIAQIYGITPQEFEFFYGRAYKRGLPAAVLAVGDAMMDKAVRGDVKAGSLFLRTRGGWTESSKVSHEVAINQLPDEERRAMADAIVERLNQSVVARAQAEAVTAAGARVK